MLKATCEYGLLTSVCGFKCYSGSADISKVISSFENSVKGFCRNVSLIPFPIVCFLSHSINTEPFVRNGQHRQTARTDWIHTTDRSQTTNDRTHRERNEEFNFGLSLGLNCSIKEAFFHSLICHQCALWQWVLGKQGHCLCLIMCAHS